MPIQVQLEDAFEQILDAAEALLKAEVAPGKALADINEVVRGDRDISPKIPALWIYSEPVTNQHRHANYETWTMPLVLAATVEDNEPTKGYRRAAKIAAGARRVLIKDRHLGLGGFVQDAQSARFEASQPWSRRGNLYDAVAVVNVIFTVFEP